MPINIGQSPSTFNTLIPDLESDVADIQKAFRFYHYGNSNGSNTGVPGQGIWGYLTNITTSVNLKAPINNPTFTGTVTIPTLSLTDPISGDDGGTGVANTGKTITLGGNLTTSGAYTTTFISTANTSVTLPTTGLLATRAGTETFTNKTFDTATAGGNVLKINGTTVSDKTGTGKFVLDTSPTITSPTLVTPTLGLATATSINGTLIPSTAGKTLATTDAATTTTAGVVVLNTSTNSTSTTTAATPSAVNSAYDLAASKWTYDSTPDFTSLTIAGGYGSNGTSLSSSGGISTDGNIRAEGYLNDAGSYIIYSSGGVAPATTTVSSSANLYQSATLNLIYRSTSASKYKVDPQPMILGNQILNLVPKTWIDKAQYVENGSSATGLIRHPGFIAEDLVEAGLEEFVTYVDGEVEGISYDRLVAAVIPVLKSQQSKIESLEARLAALEAR
jgi:hypothetical protein